MNYYHYGYEILNPANESITETIQNLGYFLGKYTLANSLSPFDLSCKVLA